MKGKFLIRAFTLIGMAGILTACYGSPHVDFVENSHPESGNGISKGIEAGGEQEKSADEDSKSVSEDETAPEETLLQND